MIYLDNAATSFPKPEAVYQALDRFARTDLANPGRAGHKMALAAERALDDCRHLLNQLFHGEGPERFVFTLNATDVATGWTTCVALKNKAQVWTFAGIKKIRAKLPFLLLGLDSDNGSEFINEILWRYCQEQQLTFTRSRPYRKNDSCFVEQKNFSVVRRAVGYQRYDTDEQLRLLDELYEVLDLYTNFFQPSMKLQAKERHGARVKKTYDTARTPYRRVLESSFIAEQTKNELRARYELLNPAQLKRQIERLQRKLSASEPALARTSKPLTAKGARGQRAVEMPPLRKATKNIASLSGLEKSDQRTV